MDAKYKGFTVSGMYSAVDMKYCRFLNFGDLGMFDVRGCLISRVSCLAFYIRMQALYLVTFIFTTKEPHEY